MSTGKTVGQMNDEHQVFLDEQPMTVLCGLPKCRWKFKGSAAAARAQAEAHRLDKHADRNPRSRSQINKEATQARQAKKAEEVAQVKAAKQQKSRSAAPFATEPKRQGGRPSRWSQEKCVAAIREWAGRNGHPPSSKDASGDPSLPSPPVAAGYCGSWADAVEQAGFPRPARGTRYSPPVDVDPEPKEVSVETLSERIIETVMLAVRAEHQRESARLATALRRFAGSVLELVQSLDPEEE